MSEHQNNLYKRSLDVLLLTDPQAKVDATYQLQKDWLAGVLVREQCEEVVQVPVPGRPSRPELVDARQVPRRNYTSDTGRLTLVHAITHIEFNAINLALDAVYRFQDMPDQYYTDWLQVAAEEGKHYTLLSDYMRDHDMAYGDLVAHNGLWEMAVKTDFDVLVRMALVPRVLEARGLDVTPGMMKKLMSVGDQRLVSILQIIFDEEIGHVRIGSHWYKSLCEQRELPPRETFLKLIDQYMQGAKFGPFETEARLAAGFSHEEMHDLLEKFSA